MVQKTMVKRNLLNISSLYYYDKDIFNRPKLEYKARDYYEHEYKEEFDNLEPRELSEDFLKSLLLLN